MFVYVFCLSCQRPHKASFFFFNDTATTEIYTLSLHDALPILGTIASLYLLNWIGILRTSPNSSQRYGRSEEHTSELQSLAYLVCRLLLEKKKLARPHQHLHESLVTPLRFDFLLLSARHHPAVL